MMTNSVPLVPVSDVPRELIKIINKYYDGGLLTLNVVYTFKMDYFGMINYSYLHGVFRLKYSDYSRELIKLIPHVMIVNGYRYPFNDLKVYTYSPGSNEGRCIERYVRKGDKIMFNDCHNSTQTYTFDQDYYDDVNFTGWDWDNKIKFRTEGDDDSDYDSDDDPENNGWDINVLP